MKKWWRQRKLNKLAIQLVRVKAEIGFLAAINRQEVTNSYYLDQQLDAVVKLAELKETLRHLDPPLKTLEANYFEHLNNEK